MSPAPSYGIVLSTCPDEETAQRLASRLVEHNLAACVNVLPGIRSFYRWQGRVESDPELLLLAKTSRERYPAVEEAIRAAHPYELPEVIFVPIAAGLAGYLEWLGESLAAPREAPR